MGIKEALSWNKMIFFKLASYIIFNKSSVWNSWVTSNITRGRAIWSIETKEKDTWTWKCILKVCNEIREHLQPSQISVADGEVNISSLVLNNGKVSCAIAYELLRTKHNTIFWGSFL